MSERTINLDHLLSRGLKLYWDQRGQIAIALPASAGEMAEINRVHVRQYGHSMLDAGGS